MDEKQKIKDILIVISIYFGLITFVAVPFTFIISVISGVGLKGFLENILNIYMVVAILIGGFGLIYAIGYFGKNKIKEVRARGYIRDISDVKYGPAIASFLLDENIETGKDYTATIIDLCRKKYIQIENNGDEYKFYLINNSVINLGEHERYVLRCIIDNEKFDDKVFKEKIEEDATRLGYLQKKKVRPFIIILKRILMFFIAAIILDCFPEDTIIYNIVGIIGMGIELSVFVTIFRLIVNRRAFERTYKGKAEAIKWKKFKNYINNYTLIKDKNIKDVVLLEEYLSFAVAIGEAKQIEKFIIKNDDYRKLIYKQLRNN